jgi:diaminopimelate decarboxylase
MSNLPTNVLHYARREPCSQAETPFYVYDLTAMTERAKLFRSQLPANFHLHFAMKANSNPQVLKVFKDLGFGVDVVSAGEMRRALECGFRADQIIFSGVGKTVAEIRSALKAQIEQINVESLEELRRVADEAKKMGLTAKVALRMNPDIAVDTHPYIRTGFRDNKFGLDFTAIPEAIEIVKSSQGALKLQGLTLHIGSQIREVEPFRAAILKTLELRSTLKKHDMDIEYFDVGGGLGIDYFSSDISQDEKILGSYTATLKEVFSGVDLRGVFLEPGRFLTARFGALVAEVQYVKVTPYKKFVIVDTGMHHLLRPALYEAFHRIELQRDSKAPQELFDVVGPICESSDTIGAERMLPSDIRAGDRIIIFDAGAYGSVMASDYNLRGRAGEHFFEGGEFR